MIKGLEVNVLFTISDNHQAISVQSPEITSVTTSCWFNYIIHNTKHASHLYLPQTDT